MISLLHYIFRYSIALYNEGRSFAVFDIEFNLKYSKNLSYTCKDVIWAHNSKYFVTWSDNNIYLFNFRNFEYEIFTNFSGVIRVFFIF